MFRLLCWLGKHAWGGKDGLPYDGERDGMVMTCRRCGKFHYFSLTEHRWVTTDDRSLHMTETPVCKRLFPLR